MTSEMTRGFRICSPVEPRALSTEASTPLQYGVNSRRTRHKSGQSRIGEVISSALPLNVCCPRTSRHPSRRILASHCLQFLL